MRIVVQNDNTPWKRYFEPATYVPASPAKNESAELRKCEALRPYLPDGPVSCQAGIRIELRPQPDLRVPLQDVVQTDGSQLSTAVGIGKLLNDMNHQRTSHTR